jgi:hypothetical protein
LRCPLCLSSLGLPCCTSDDVCGCKPLLGGKCQ